MKVFDFDNTIYRGESSVDFSFYMIRHNRKNLTIYGDRKIDAFYTDSRNVRELMRVSREVYIVKNGIPVHL